MRALGWSSYLGAQVALLRSEIAVRLRRRGRLASREFERAESDAPTRHVDDRAGGVSSAEKAVEHARRRARVLAAAAAVGPIRSRCLVRAVALRRWLETEGHPGARVRIGVRRESGAFEAHAWVELLGARVDASSFAGGDVDGFVQLDEVRISDSL